MSDDFSHALRAAFGAFMTGVTVVTARSSGDVDSDDNGGAPVGVTANSFTSVSLQPPLLLVCLARTLGSYDVFYNAEHFAVNILAGNQEDIADTFARDKGDRFSKVQWQADAYQSPLIAGAAAHFSCESHLKTEVGSHLILIGKVLDFANHNRRGLGRHNGGYFCLDSDTKR